MIIKKDGFFHGIVELLTSFPKSPRLSKSEFGVKSYAQNTKTQSAEMYRADNPVFTGYRLEKTSNSVSIYKSNQMGFYTIL